MYEYKFKFKYGINTGDSMNEMQNQLFPLLCEVDRICRKFNISYTLQGGTLLGAVRENGFIAWDDDIDIAMSRQEYERFMEVFPNQSDNYTLLDGFIGGALQIIDQKNPNITADIFVYDYITENKLFQKVRIYGLIILQAMLKTKETIKLTSTEDHSALKYNIYRFVSLLGRPFPQKAKLRFYKWFSKNAFVGKKKYIHLSNDSARYLHRIIPVEYIKRLKEQSFEGKNFYIFEDFDTVLKLSYGEDYMTPKEDLSIRRRHKRFRENLSNKV